MTIGVWVLVGVLTSFTLMTDHASASDSANSRGQTAPQIASVPPEGGNKVLSAQPRPRPAGAPAVSAQIEQCRWLGMRIVSLLSRDDAMTAKDFDPFYQRFGCPMGHLAQAFGCVVAAGEQAESQDLANRVEGCWTAPVTAAKPPSLSGTEPPSQGGSERTANGT